MKLVGHKTERMYNRYNITNDGGYDPKTGEACEDYVYQVVKAYIAATVKR